LLLTDEDAEGDTPSGFLSASFSRQHPAKAGQIDADVCILHHRFLGVCDGVSQVASLNISPAEFPRDLLDQCWEVLQTTAGSDLIEVLVQAFLRSSCLGSTTCVLCELGGNRLAIASVGDSELRILRRGPDNLYEVIFRTVAGKANEYTPHQVCRLPGTQDTDTVSNIRNTAQSYTTSVKCGDLLVLGSDGVFDNLFDGEIETCVNRCCVVDGVVAVPARAQLESAATAIVEAAVGKVGSFEAAPFGIGGKADDTLAVVAAVAPRSLLLHTELPPGPGAGGVCCSVAPPAPVCAPPALADLRSSCSIT
jgi:protein phosphatase PTC7